MLETDQDRAIEDRITQELCDKWGMVSGKMGPYSPFDRYLFKQDVLSCVVEIKDRKNRLSNTFPTILLNLDKYISLATFQALTTIPAYYVVGFSDGLFYINAGTIRNSGLIKYVVKGRKDRPGTNNDVRPAIEIPFSLFKKI